MLTHNQPFHKPSHLTQQNLKLVQSVKKMGINLASCKKLKTFLPISGKSPAFPKELCKTCLFTGPDHNQTHDMNTWINKVVCPKSKLHALLCPDATCDHKSLQDYFRNHFNPTKGLRNFTDFNRPNTNARTPQVSNHAMKLSHACNMKMTLNNALIGSTTCMSEVLSVRLEDNTILKLKFSMIRNLNIQCV